ncbi:MAG: DUF448 domain-containing protein [Miltoncostaeaceae bacterium]
MAAARARHIPERRCLGCGARGPKGTLARFTAVASGDGYVLMRDDGAARGGRGLYVHPQRDCFERAVARRAFARGARVRGEIAVDPALVVGFGEEE